MNETYQRLRLCTHLVQIANNPSRWVIALAPPEAGSTPAQSSEEPITFKAPHLEPSQIQN
jgi:hypothetical protein